VSVNDALINQAVAWLNAGDRIGSATVLIEQLVKALELAEAERKKMIADMRPG